VNGIERDPRPAGDRGAPPDLPGAIAGIPGMPAARREALRAELESLAAGFYPPHGSSGGDNGSPAPDPSGPPGHDDASAPAGASPNWPRQQIVAIGLLAGAALLIFIWIWRPGGSAESEINRAPSSHARQAPEAAGEWEDGRLKAGDDGQVASDGGSLANRGPEVATDEHFPPSMATVAAGTDAHGAGVPAAGRPASTTRSPAARGGASRTPSRLTQATGRRTPTTEIGVSPHGSPRASPEHPAALGAASRATATGGESRPCPGLGKPPTAGAAHAADVITGRVLAHDCTPLADRVVVFAAEGTVVEYLARTEADGGYRLALAPGRYRAAVDSDDPAAVAWLNGVAQSTDVIVEVAPGAPAPVVDFVAAGVDR